MVSGDPRVRAATDDGSARARSSPGARAVRDTPGGRTERRGPRPETAAPDAHTTAGFDRCVTVTRLARHELAPTDLPPTGPLEPGRVHVWLFESSPERANAVAGALSDEEGARATRVRAERGARFAAVRGTLRLLLSAQTELPPRSIPIAYGRHGKPRLAPELGSPLAFNVSHSSSLAAIAIASHREVGVDLELRRPRKRLALLADAVLGPSERAWFDGLPDDARLAAFLDVWSAKEAFSKLIGRGLTVPFRRVRLSEPGRAASAVSVDGSDWPLAPCAVTRLAAPADYSAALSLQFERRIEELPA